jgi:WD40 repeat protein
MLGMDPVVEASVPDTTDLTPLLAKTHSPLGVKFHRLGDYELLEEIARGGMGVVFRARQLSLNRTVALKLILGGQLAAPAMVKRFLVEAEAAASLHHPNIASIHETGECEGHHFYSMELVEGAALHQRAAEYQLLALKTATNERKPAARQRQRAIARLMANVARAVDYAHQRGVLHRDLKPSNILIDGEGEPHLVDFGLAKLVNEERTQFTLSGAVLGTPNYMAPELASGGAAHATTAADIYSLGAILYELLAGKAPFQAPTAVEIWRRALEEEPENPASHNRHVDADLATIALRCLEKEPQRRYASARALAEDLERWRAGEPIAARPVGAGAKFWRWCRRKPSLAGLALTAIALAFAGVIGVSTQWRRAERQARTTKLNLYAADIGAAHQALREGNLGRARELLDAYRPVDGAEDLRGFEWRLLRDSAQGEYAVAFLGHTGTMRSLAFSPDGKWLVTASAESAVQVWDLRRNAWSRTLTGHTGSVNCVAFSFDSRLMATAGQDGTLKLWDTTSWRVTTQLVCRPYAYQVAFSPAGPLLAYSEGGTVNLSGGRVRLWNYAKGKLVQRGTNAGSRIAFSPDGKKLVTGNQEGLALWDTASGHNLWSSTRLHSVLFIAFSPKGSNFAVCNFNGEVALFDVDDPDRSVTLKGLARSRGIAFSPDGVYLAAASGDQTIRVWNTAAAWERTNAPMRTLWGHGSGARCLAFSPDGNFLASGDKDGVVLLWDFKARSPSLLIPNVPVSYTNAPPVFSRDSGWMAAATATEGVALCNIRTLERLQTFPAALIPLALSDDHQTLVVMSTNYVYQEWDIGSGQLRREAQFVRPEQAFTAKLFPDGKLLAVGYLDGTFAIYEVEARRELWRHRGHKNNIREFAFSRDGRLFATASQDFTAKLWELPTRRELATLTGHGDEVWTIALSPDATVAATGSSDHTVRLWSVPDGRPVAVLTGHKEGVFRTAFSPDGKTLATASDDDTVRLWHLPTRREVARLNHGANVKLVSFTPNGEWLVSNSDRRTVHFYRAPSFTALDEADRRKIVRSK